MSPDYGLSTDGPVQRRWLLWIGSVVFVSVAGALVIVRMAIRLSKRAFWYDDGVLILAIALSAMLSLSNIQTVRFTNAAIAGVTPDKSLQNAHKWTYIEQISYKTVPTLVKASVVLTYYRIFKTSSKLFHWICHFLLTAIIAQGLAALTATVLQCLPIAAFWDSQRYPETRCTATEFSWIVSAIFQMIFIIVLMVLPMRQMLWSSMTNADKTGVLLVYCVGLVVLSAAIIRALTISFVINLGQRNWGPAPAMFWDVVDSNSSIICASMLAMRVPFLRLLHDFGVSTPTIASPGARRDVLPFPVRGPAQRGSPVGIRSSTLQNLPQIYHPSDLRIDASFCDDGALCRETCEETHLSDTSSIAPSLPPSIRPSTSVYSHGHIASAASIDYFIPHGLPQPNFEYFRGRDSELFRESTYSAGDASSTGWTMLQGGIHVQNDFDIASEARGSVVEPWVTSTVEARNARTESPQRVAKPERSMSLKRVRRKEAVKAAKSAAELRRAKYGMSWEEPYKG